MAKSLEPQVPSKAQVEALSQVQTAISALSKLKTPSDIAKAYERIVQMLRPWQAKMAQASETEKALYKQLIANLPKKLEEARLNVFEKWIEALEKQPNLLAKYRPNLDKLVAQLKSANPNY